MPQTREGLTACVSRILRDPDFPGCSENVRSLLALSASSETTAKALAGVVLRDVSLTLQVLRTANSAYFNRSGQPILSVSHAVALMGVERVVRIASGLKFLEQFAVKAPGIRELVLLSLLTGSQARSIAERMQYPNPDEAYLCGLLRNLGELLVSYYEPHQYAKLLVAMLEEQLPEKAVCRRVLGFTFEELAAEVLKVWNLGSKVLAGIRPPPDGPLTGRGDEQLLLARITMFSHQMVRATHRSEPEQAKAQLKRLLERHGRSLQVTEKDIQSILNDAVSDAQDIFRSLGLKVDGLKLRNQVDSALDVLQLAGPEDGAPATPSALDLGIFRLRSALRKPEDLDLNEFLGIALDAIAGSGLFDRAAFALLDESKTTLEARIGRGTNCQTLVDEFVFPVSNRVPPIGTAITQRKDFVIDLGRDDRYLTSPLVALATPGVFALYPVVVNQIAVGCLYLDRPDRNARFPDAELSKVSNVRDLIAAAVDCKRSHDSADPIGEPDPASNSACGQPNVVA